MIEFVGLLVGLLVEAIFGSHLTERGARKHEERLRRAGRLTCRLRMLDGRHPNLSPMWSIEAVRLAPGRISNRRLDLPTAGLDLSTARRPEGLELGEMPEGSTVVVIRVSGGVVLWALPEESAAWALDRVAPAPAPNGAEPGAPCLGAAARVGSP
ncbi:hypothetical protein [Oerskovia turbata]